jgi:predicted NAD-dependent protein-ADP-ribosyltransferase YbiA (DUF1768 family)
MLYMTIYLYEESDAYGEFSNFARYPIVIHDVIWYTSEHDFQAMKFPHDPRISREKRTTKACHDIKTWAILGKLSYVLIGKMLKKI